MLGHFRKAKVSPKRIVREFPVTPDAHVPVGTYIIYSTMLHVAHFQSRYDAVCNTFCARTIRRRYCQLVRRYLDSDFRIFAHP